MTNPDKISNLLDAIQRQYPHFPSTFNPCECNRSIARGTGKCAICYEEELSELVGHDQAEYYHKKVRKLSALYIKLVESGRDND